MLKSVVKVAYRVLVTLYVKRRLDQIKDARRRIRFLEERCAQMWTRLEAHERALNGTQRRGKVN